MKVSLSVLGQEGEYKASLKEMGIELNAVSIPAIGNPTTPKGERFEAWAKKMSKNIEKMLEKGVQREDILINAPINQIVEKNICDVAKLASFVEKHQIAKIIMISGNANMGEALVSVERYVAMFRALTVHLQIKLYVGLYPSQKLGWCKECFGINTLLEQHHFQKQKEKVLLLDELVDGYMTQIVLNGKSSAKWLNSISKFTTKPIFLGISAPTSKHLDLMHIRTQLFYICKDKSFLEVEKLSELFKKVLLTPSKWFAILSSLNWGTVDMMWRFHLTRRYALETIIDELKRDIDSKSELSIHFNSGGQSIEKSMPYVRQLAY